VLAFKNWGQIHNNKPGYKFGHEDCNATCQSRRFLLSSSRPRRSGRPAAFSANPGSVGGPYGRVGGAIASRAIAILKKDPARSGASTNGAGDGLAPPRPGRFRTWRRSVSRPPCVAELLG
jgi:hypothetical protein